MVTFGLPISVDLMDWLQKYIVHVHKVKKIIKSMYIHKSNNTKNVINIESGILDMYIHLYLLCKYCMKQLNIWELNNIGTYNKIPVLFMKQILTNLRHINFINEMHEVSSCHLGEKYTDQRFTLQVYQYNHIT